MAHQIVLNWAVPASGDAPTAYNVHKATAAAGPFAVIGSATLLTFTDTAVVAGTQYWYEVTSVNSAGESGPSNEVNATVPLTAPNPPSGLVASAS